MIDVAQGLRVRDCTKLNWGIEVVRFWAIVYSIFFISGCNTPINAPNFKGNSSPPMAGIFLVERSESESGDKTESVLEIQGDGLRLTHVEVGPGQREIRFEALYKVQVVGTTLNVVKLMHTTDCRENAMKSLTGASLIFRSVGMGKVEILVLEESGVGSVLLARRVDSKDIEKIRKVLECGLRET